MKGQPLAKLAYETIKEQILSGELWPGTIVIAHELAARLGMSQTPVREALNLLCAERLASAAPRTGYRIAPVTVRDAQEIFQLRLALEPLATGLGLRRATDSDVQALKAELTDHSMRGTRLRPDSPENIALIRAEHDRFHLSIAELSGQRELVDMIRYLLQKSRRMYLLTFLVSLPAGSRAAQPRDDTRHHQMISEALFEGDHEAAVDAMRAHVRSTYQMIIESLFPRLEEIAGTDIPQVLDAR